MTASTLQRWFAPAKRLLPKAVWSPVRAIATAVITPIRFSTTTGHWKSSLQMSARGASGSPIPWYTYPAIDFLSQREFSNRNVLEFGGGQSTLWWSMRARSVLTVEEDNAWYENLRLRVGCNVSLHHLPADRVTRSTASVEALLDAGPISKFDIIIIDGHLRKELTALSVRYLADKGALIVDNAEGYGIYEALKSINCKRIDFFGFAPGVSLRHCTSVAFIDDCFLLQCDNPIRSIE